MQQHLFVRMVFLWLSLVIFISCREDSELVCEPPPITGQSLRILPLGDSRVEGDPSPDGYQSYRYYLWRTFQQQNWSIDFIGSKQSERTYPPVQNTCFDLDHEGTGGEVTAGILSTVENIDYDPAPDIVLLGIGGNDLLGEELSPQIVLKNVQAILQELQGRYPKVTIFVEEIAPARTDLMTPALTSRLSEFYQGISDLADQAGDQVINIDMHTDWSDSYMADEVHYNESGAREVANRYFQAIDIVFDP